jgi:MFS family permease
MVRGYISGIRKFSPQARLILITQFLFAVGHNTTWVLRNLYYREVGFEVPYIGKTLSAVSLGSVVVILLLGRHLDRLKLKTLFYVGVTLQAAALLGIALFPMDPHALFFCFLQGAAFAVYQVTMAPFYARHSGPHERPYLFGFGAALRPLAGIMTTVSMTLGTSVWGENRFSYEAMILIASGIVAVCFLPLLFVREKPPEEEEPPAETYEEEAEKEEKPKFNWRIALKFCAPELVLGLGAGLTIPIFNLYFRERFDQDAGTIALFFGAAQAVQVVAFLLAPIIATRFGAVKSVVAIQLSSIPFFLVMAFTEVLPVAIVAFLIRQVCMNMVHPVTANFMMEVVRPDQRVRINAAKHMSRRGAWVGANWISGLTIAHAPFIVDGFTTVMLMTITLYLFGCGMFYGFFHRQKVEDEAIRAESFAVGRSPGE